MRAASPLRRLLLGAGLAACTGSAPPEPPIEMPSIALLDYLSQRAPAAMVQPPLTLDTKSCVFARYIARTPSNATTFVLIHPLRERCELWTGGSPSAPVILQYCRFSREDLLPIDVTTNLGVFRIDDPEHCVFEGIPPPPEPENANARAATQAFTSNRDQLD